MSEGLDVFLPAGFRLLRIFDRVSFRFCSLLLNLVALKFVPELIGLMSSLFESVWPGGLSALLRGWLEL